MKLRKTALGCALLFLLASNVHAEVKEAPKGLLSSDHAKVSYSIGLSIGNNFKNQSVALELEAFVAGIQDGMNASQPQISLDEMRRVMAEFSQKMKEKQESQGQEMAMQNKATGEEFLKRNKMKKGITTLPSGLQYEVLRKGDGKSPGSGDTVTTHYRGTLVDGTEFDSSYSRGNPATFRVDGVIKGWTEALQLMQVGSKWKLYVPSELAYGSRGAGQLIGPNSTLIFEVELISVQ